MAFPDANRVLYDKNPLQEVICQLRFPSILKIEAEPPVAFQERIRAALPFYNPRPALKLPAGMPAELASLIAKELPFGSGQTAHEFTSRDEKWKLALTRDFVALTCGAYERWEDFKGHLQGPLGALQELYAPGFFTRIGLRYRDVIRRSALGLQGVSWSDLLQPWIAGPFASREVTDDIEGSSHELAIRLADGHSRIQVHHGQVPDGEELCYLIDADFFDPQQTEPANAFESLNFLNKQARLFFRWCIHKRLHDAMGPRPLPDA